LTLLRLSTEYDAKDFSSEVQNFLFAPYFSLIKPYLKNRTFSVHVNNSYSLNFAIPTGVPRGSNIAPSLYSIFTHDTLFSPHTTLGTYADETIILASNNDPPPPSMGRKGSQVSLI